MFKSQKKANGMLDWHHVIDASLHPSPLLAIAQPHNPGLQHHIGATIMSAKKL